MRWCIIRCVVIVSLCASTSLPSNHLDLLLRQRGRVKMAAQLLLGNSFHPYRMTIYCIRLCRTFGRVATRCLVAAQGVEICNALDCNIADLAIEHDIRFCIRIVILDHLRHTVVSRGSGPSKRKPSNPACKASRAAAIQRSGLQQWS